MRCSKAQTYLSQELDEQLPADVIVDLDRHLDTCAPCREYREDLALGQRLLAASEPELPENFEWKLQLRLNQALRESAGEHLFPWQQAEEPVRRQFLRGFGTSVAVGLAAVLALAMVIGPQGVQLPVAVVPGGTYTAPVGAVADMGGGSDDTRRELYTDNIFAGPARPVSSNHQGVLGSPQGSSLLTQGWSRNDGNANRTVLYLQNEVRRLRTESFHQRREIEALQTRLDTVPGAALDLQESR